MKGRKDYVRYSGIAFQMIAIIGLGTWLGHQADVWMDNKFPVFTLIGIFASLGLSLYSLIKDLTKTS